MSNLFNDKPEPTRYEKLKKSKALTNKVTKEAIEYLNGTEQFKVWRNNNIPSVRTEIIKEPGKEDQVKVHFKKNQKMVSTLDIIGYRICDGKHVEIEVKTGKDKLDPEQRQHIEDMRKAGCIAFAFSDKHTLLLQITPYMTERKLAF